MVTSSANSSGLRWRAVGAGILAAVCDCRNDARALGVKPERCACVYVCARGDFGRIEVVWISVELFSSSFRYRREQKVRRGGGSNWLSIRDNVGLLKKFGEAKGGGGPCWRLSLLPTFCMCMGNDVNLACISSQPPAFPTPQTSDDPPRRYLRISPRFQLPRLWPVDDHESALNCALTVSWTGSHLPAPSVITPHWSPPAECD